MAEKKNGQFRPAIVAVICTALTKHDDDDDDEHWQHAEGGRQGGRKGLLISVAPLGGRQEGCDSESRSAQAYVITRTITIKPGRLLLMAEILSLSQCLLSPLRKLESRGARAKRIFFCHLLLFFWGGVVSL